MTTVTSVCIKKIKTIEFLCSHFNIKGEKKQHFLHIMLYYFKKGKNTTEMQSKISAVYGEGAVTDRSVKMACKFWAGDFSLDIFRHI